MPNNVRLWDAEWNLLYTYADDDPVAYSNLPAEHPAAQVILRHENPIHMTAEEPDGRIGMRWSGTLTGREMVKEDGARRLRLRWSWLLHKIDLN